MAEGHSREVERWLPIPGFSDFYEASNLGRIRSRRNRTNTKIGKILVARICKKSGYATVGLSINGLKVIRSSVHRLVLLAFVGPCPKGMVACHGPDGSKTNNALSNLRWGTRQENEADKYSQGTKRLGESVSTSKLTEEDVRTIRRLSTEGVLTRKAIAKQFGIDPKQVANIRKREQWAHVT